MKVYLVIRDDYEGGGDREFERNSEVVAVRLTRQEAQAYVDANWSEDELMDSGSTIGIDIEERDTNDGVEDKGEEEESDDG